ncbi:hypothetical protein [Streptomyces coeruleorubidus]|uniref:TPM domain-containing protein n=1 Tax=Streptomyces coeruleorubidus TaxID=116188 RepID=A0A5J6IEI5_STRC4|nr:hypothetical protein [Streptomyces coeruleorubidus]QEV27115.1 hypothetical protein CP976_25320 [Streptomyces coeruleorubidus]GGT95136.1 hypothetical protein GCM10010256_64000 [Streptomyces coeruleorubidus]
MSTDVKRVVTVLAALLLVALTTTPARAGDGDAPSAGQRIAEALRTSPVYVDEAYADAVPPSRQRELAERIRRTGLPIKVVLTPHTKGDAFDGDSDVLAGVVRDRLPDERELILITTDGEFPDSLNGYEWPADTHQAEDAVDAVGFLDETRDAGLADLTAKAVELVAEGKGTERYEEAMKDLDDAAPARKPEPGKPGDSRWWLWPLAAVPALALAALATRALLRSRKAVPAVPQLVFATARAADERELRRRAEAEVLALGEATQAAGVSTTPGLQHALDAYAAAGRVLDEARGVPDLAGVLALTQEGRDALAGSPGLPLCFFNPLHGRAALRTGWRPLGRRDRLDVAVCQDCADALRDRRAPEVLTDRAGDGRTVPYFELPAGRSVWSATGYGSLMQPLDGFNSRGAKTG